MTTKLAGPDNFEVILAKNFKGYYSSADPTTIEGDVFARGSQNIYKNIRGNIGNRPGRKRYDDEDDTTVAGVKTGKTWSTSFGKHLVLRASNGKFQVWSDIVTTDTFVWYDLLTGLGTNLRFVLGTWWNNTLKKDQLLLVNGDSNLYMWSGGLGKLSSTTSNTIVLTETIASSGFNTASGTVIINGTEYTYSGSSASTLTGVSPDPTSQANAQAVIQKVITTATTPASGFDNDFLKVINNQVYVGSYNSRLIYISEDDDYLDYTVPANRVGGDPELIVLDENCTGIGASNGKTYFSAGFSEWSAHSFLDVLVGSVLEERSLLEKLPVSQGAAAYAHEFIDNYNDQIVYLSKDQQVRALGIFTNLTDISYPVISKAIATDLRGEDFTQGQLRVISEADLGDLIYLIAPNSGVAYIRQTKMAVAKDGSIRTESQWFAPFVWGIGQVDSRNGTTIGFSNSNPQMYTLWNTDQYHDDSPSGQLAYTSIFLTQYKSYGRRQGKTRFDKVFWEGYMTQGTRLNGAIYYDYQGATFLSSFYIHDQMDSSPAKDRSFSSGVIPPSLGDASLGDNPLGDITSVIYGNTVLQTFDLVPKFRIITQHQILDSYEFALMAFSSAAGSQWELIAVGPNVSLSPFSATEIIKVNVTSNE